MRDAIYVYRTRKYVVCVRPPGVWVCVSVYQTYNALADDGVETCTYILYV